MTERNRSIPIEVILGTHGPLDIPKLKVLEHTLSEAIAISDKPVVAVVEASDTPISVSDGIFTQVKEGVLPSIAYLNALKAMSREIPYFAEEDLRQLDRIIEKETEQGFLSQVNATLDRIILANPGRLFVLYEKSDHDSAISAAAEMSVKKITEDLRKGAVKFVLEGDLDNGMAIFQASVFACAESIKEREERVVGQIEEICATQDIGGIVTRFGSAHIGLNILLKQKGFSVYRISDTITESDIEIFSPYLALVRKARFRGFESISMQDWNQGLVAHAWLSSLYIRMDDENWSEEQRLHAGKKVTSATRIFRDEESFRHLSEISNQLGFSQAIRAISSTSK